MRNLKRALSLTLASVMLLGMMVVGAGAAGFPDVADDNDNVEAIEVLQAIEVMVGNADTGNFEPDRSVTRTEMAVVMANLLKLDYKYYEASCPFWDVPTWAKSYVGACYANKITSGYGDGTYGALDPITPVQAASMMMRALGYFQYSEDYKDGFETATVRQGTQIGIFEGIGSSADKDMTRGQVARMALNALESEMVTFTGTPGSTYTASNGESITVGYVAEYTSRTSTELKYKAIEDRTSDASLDSNHRGQYYIQLGEELYNGKLTKKYARDDFERPSINWQYDGKDIGTYVDYELLVVGGTFTTEVTGSELYDLLTYSTIRDNDLLTYVDGVATNVKKEELVRSNKNGVNQSGTGVLTEVFVDQSRDEVIITGINTYLAKANSNYNKTNESLSLKVYTGRVSKGNVTSNTKIVDGAVVPQAADVQKDDYKLVYMSGKESNGITYDVVRMFDTNIVASASITKWSKNDNKVVGDFTANGENYKTNVKAFYDGGNVLTDYNEQLLTDMSYNIYEDRYGNAIGVDLAEGTKNYVFITGYDRLGSNISVRTADAAAIFLDGTMDVITVNVTDTNKYIEKSKNGQFEKWQNWNNDAYGQNGRRSENRWYTYTVNNNGVYTLKPVERFFWTDYAELNNGTVQEKILNTANLFVDDSRPTSAVTPLYTNQGRAYGNDNSIYITVDVDEVDTSVGKLNAITDVQGVYTGAQNVKLELNKSDRKNLGELKENNAAYIYSIYDNNYYLIASVVLGEAQGAVANYAYILGDAKNERVEFESANAKASGDATYYWEFDAVLNGEKTTLTAKTKYASVFSGLEKFHVQELRFDGDYVVKIADVKADKVMTENNVPVTDKMDVYDVGHVTAGNATGKKTDTGNEPSNGHADTQYGYSSHRLDGTIELVGRSLYVERGIGRDVGLALTSDAKAVLIQYENDKREVTSCGSVDEAVGRLADAEPNNDLHPGVQFRGRIVAALESNGAASWVVIISDTPLNTTDKDYNYNYSTTINNVEVRLVNSATSSVQNRNITATLDRNGELTIGIPVASNVVGASASRITATVDGVYRADEAHPVVTVRGVQSKQAQWTLSGYDLTEYNKIVVTIYNFDVSFGAAAATVTVNDVNNGLASMTSTPAGGWKVGDTFTVTAKAGYTVTVTGASKDGNTYTINSTSVVVTITKNQIPADSVTVTYPEHSAVYTVEDGKYTLIPNGGSVKTGATIQVDPIEVLNVTGTTVDADGEGTVGTENIVVAAKENAKWNLGWGMWRITLDDAGNYDLIPFTPRESTNARSARAVTVPPVGTDITQEGATWVETLKADKGSVYEQKAGEVTWTITVTETGRIQIRVKGTYTKAQLDAAFEKMDAGEHSVIKTQAAGENHEPADSNIKVELKAAAPFTAKISEYVPTKGVAVDALTEEEVASALTAAAKAAGKNWTFTKESISFKDGKATVPGTTTVVSLEDASGAAFNAANHKPTQVYKVTYPGGEMLVPAAGKTVDNVTPGVPALLNKNEVYGTASKVEVNLGTPATKPGNTKTALIPDANPDYDGTDATIAANVDTEFVAAVKLMTEPTPSNGKGTGLYNNGEVKDNQANNAQNVLLKLTVIDPKTGTKVGLEPEDYIQAGTTVYVSAGSTLTTPEADGKYAHAGKSVTLTVNVKDKLTFSVGADGTISGDKMTFQIPTTYATGKTALEFGAALTAPTADVMVDGVKVERKDMGTPNDLTDDKLVIPGMKGYSLIYKATDTEEWTEVAGGTLDVDGTMTVPTTSLAATIPVENKAMQLKRGYKVVTGKADTFTVQVMNEEGELEDLGNVAYYPKDTTEKVYIKGEANVILSKKNTTELPGKTYQILNNTDGDPAIWEVPVTGNITENDYAALITIDDTKAAALKILDAKALTADEKNKVTIAETGSYVTLAQADVKISGKFVSDDESVIKDSEVKVDVVVKKDKSIDITVTSSKTIDQDESTGDNKTLGKIVLTFEGYDLSVEDITLVVPRKTAP